MRSVHGALSTKIYLTVVLQSWIDRTLVAFDYLLCAVVYFAMCHAKRAWSSHEFFWPAEVLRLRPERTDDFVSFV